MPFRLTEGLIEIFASEFPLILSFIFGGCCSNVVSLEVLVTDAPKSGQLITFGQFLFVALDGARHHITWGRYGPVLKPTVVPLHRWIFLVVMFFIVSILNNLALGYNISMPLHIIFRSGGLIINMILGALLLKKRYSKSQIIGVLFVTAGVILTTLDNANNNTQSNSSSTPEFFTGITLLLVAMIISAGMGLFQEVTYRKYGKQWREGLFYIHFLALPFFLFFYNDLAAQIKTYNNSPKLIIPDQLSVLSNLLPLSGQIPKLWGFLLLNLVTQYVCVTGVNRMTATATSLTLNLVLNLRKFVSLLFSIMYFDNHFGLQAKIGTLLVFLGTLTYTKSNLASPKLTGKK